MIGETSCYQYIYIDNQQLHWREYHLTGRHYSSRKACEKDLHRDTEAKIMFHIIGMYRPSKLTGELAEMATHHEEGEVKNG